MQRLKSLDIFRGATIAAMIIVNNPGSWDAVYSPLLHAPWHGCTPTDLIFPFFLFIVGVSICFSLSKAQKIGISKKELLRKISFRSLKLIYMGILLQIFPLWNTSNLSLTAYIFLGLGQVLIFTTLLFKPRIHSSKKEKLYDFFPWALSLLLLFVFYPYIDIENIRIPGVLQRIGIVFALASSLYLLTSLSIQRYIILFLAIGYFLLLSYVNVPSLGYPSIESSENLPAYIDRLLLGASHLWQYAKSGDPEGLLSTIPSLINALVGIQVGSLLLSTNNSKSKIYTLFIWGGLLLSLGWMWSFIFPLNKHLWTSSYALYTSGWAVLVFTFFYVISDVYSIYKGKIFTYFGTNSIFAYILSSAIASLLITIPLGRGSLGQLFFTFWVDIGFQKKLASLFFALSLLGFILFICKLLYDRRIYLKV